MSQNAYLNRCITILANELFKNRYHYADFYQEKIRTACELFFGSSDVQTETLKDTLLKKIGINIITLLWELNNGKEAVYEKLTKYLRESLDEAGIPYSKKEVDEAASAIADILIVLLVDYTDYAITGIEHSEGLGQAHFPYIYLAWMQSMDVNYNADAEVFMTNGSYRTVIINCPVDVDVYDDDDNLVAQIISDIPQDVGSSIRSGINRDGEKIVTLPAMGSYTVRLTATGSGSMTYSITEYNPRGGGYSRILNYYEIPIMAGMTFSSDIPAYSAADLDNNYLKWSSTQYSLSHDGVVLTADADLTGKEATEAWYMVDAEADNTDHGLVMGGGIRQPGNFALVSAYAYQGFEFDGWYMDDVKISSDSEYRFLVRNDVTLTAKFTPSQVLGEDEQSDDSDDNTDNSDDNRNDGSNDSIAPEQSDDTAGRWIKQDGKWWYQKHDNTYPYSCWMMINGKWYLFDAEGWMKTDWVQTADGLWYYLDQINGDMKTGWILLDSKWYFLDDINGDMKIGWIQTNNGKAVSTVTPDHYKANENGEWIP